MMDIGMTQQELSTLSKVSIATLRAMVNGPHRKFSQATLASVSRALGWPGDYLAGVARGDDVEEQSKPSSELQVIADGLQAISDRLAEVEARVAELESRPGLPDPES